MDRQEEAALTLLREYRGHPIIGPAIKGPRIEFDKIWQNPRLSGGELAYIDAALQLYNGSGEMTLYAVLNAMDREHQVKLLVTVMWLLRVPPEELAAVREWMFGEEP